MIFLMPCVFGTYWHPLGSGAPCGEAGAACEAAQSLQGGVSANRQRGAGAVTMGEPPGVVTMEKPWGAPGDWKWLGLINLLNDLCMFKNRIYKSRSRNLLGVTSSHLWTQRRLWEGGRFRRDMVQRQTCSDRVPRLRPGVFSRTARLCRALHCNWSQLCSRPKGIKRPGDS